jgi:hypothetical protein
VAAAGSRRAARVEPELRLTADGEVTRLGVVERGFAQLDGSEEADAF